jgi:oligosaccharyltransferase complex subunit beta
MSYGETNYDHIIVFASSEESVQLRAKDIFEFFDAGNNVMMLGNIDQSKYFRSLLNGFGLDSLPQT